MHSSWPEARRSWAARARVKAANLRSRRTEQSTRDEMAEAFDTFWYLSRNLDVATAGLDPLLHFIRHGSHEGRDPHPLFDTSWYLDRNADVDADVTNPFLHYLRSGWHEGRDPNPLFDSDWYLATYPDVAAAGVNPMLHYARRGAGEGRDPNPLFDTSWYADTYPDVVRAGMNPLAHYLHDGEKQERLPGPLGARKTIPVPPTARTARARVFHTTDPREEPDVTILIPVHGAWYWTERCLLALEQTEAVSRARVIVVNDASPDDTVDRLRAFPWVEVVSAEQNLGFVGAVNLGVRQVRASHVLLLNNDTEPLPGFLDAMMRRLKRDSDVALVGARLVYPDGHLQDAGSIVWTGGDGWNYGRGENPDASAYLHSREVDYCTGAAVLVRGGVLRELGGLDERFRPAYYEDTDLAFAIRARGFRAVYEPEATVVHHEGGTHGTDANAGGKAHQVLNREVFRAKWRAELRDQAAYGEVPLAIAATHGLKPIVMYVDHQPLTPDKDSGSFRAGELLRIMQGLGYSVVFAALHGDRGYDSAVRRMRADGIQVIRDTKTLRDFLRSVGSWVEAVVLSRVDVAWEWLPVVRSGDATVPVIFDTVDLHHLREKLEAELHDSRLGRIRARATEARELRLVSISDATIVVSESERSYLAATLPDADVTVVSNVHPASNEPAPYCERSGLLFVGSFLHSPNVDGIEWFLREVWPLVDVAVRKDGIDIVGSSIPPDLAAYASEEVRIRGWVPDVVPFLQRARLSVAPLRFGAGVKGKIGEAWSFGLPVVGTTTALDAMLKSAEAVEVMADDPEPMASRIAEIYLDEDRWLRASRAGRRCVEQRFSVAEARRSMSGLLQRVAEVRARPDVTSHLLRRQIPYELLR